MPLTQVDEKVALLVIDLQKGIVGLPTAHPTGEVVANAARMARAFRERRQTVVLVNVAGRAPGRTDAGMRNIPFPPDWTELVPELEQAQGDVLITKQRVGAFLGTALDEELKKRDVTQVFLCGVATGSGVESTARSAFDLGYNVVFVSDAMTDMSAEIHANCIGRSFPKLGEVETVEGVLGKMQVKSE
jgi:nicotinamidase-related amidase